MGKLYVDAAHAQHDDVLLPQGPVRRRGQAAAEDHRRIPRPGEVVQQPDARRAASTASSRWMPRSTRRTGTSMRLATAGSMTDWHPVFNDAKGVQAIEMMKEIAHYAQQGFTAAANDECMIAYQQDTGVMGLQWATRAKAMDDPAKSRVVGKIDWVAPPQGHARILRRRLRDLGVQQAGPRHAVPHHRHLVQPGQHARRRVAAGSAAQIAARRSGAAQGEPLLSGRAGIVRASARRLPRCRSSTRWANSSPGASCRR